MLEKDPAAIAVYCEIELVNAHRPVESWQRETMERTLPCNMLLRTEVARQIGGFPEHPAFRGRAAGEDAFFRRELYQRGKVVKLPEPLFRYRASAGGAFDFFLDRAFLENGRRVFRQFSKEEMDGSLDTAVREYHESVHRRELDRIFEPLRTSCSATFEFHRLAQCFAKVDGYLHPAEGYTLYSFARRWPAAGATVEIGSFKGLSTCWLAEGCRDGRHAKVVAVDHFQGSPEHKAGGSHPDADVVSYGSTLATFRRNLEEQKLTEWVTVRARSSAESSKGWAEPIRLLFIDGEHSNASVREDFKSWSPFVAPHGLVIFHNVGVFPAVTEFYAELCSRGDGWKERCRFRSLGILERTGKEPSVTAEALHGRGLELLKNKQREEAVTCLEDAVRLNPHSGEMRVNLAVAYAQLHRIDDAIREFRKSMEILPESGLARANLGLAYIRCGRHQEAAEVLAAAARLDPESADVHNHLGIAHAGLERADEAARSYARAIELRPRFHAAHTNLGNLRRSQGRLEEALACYDEALRLCPPENDPDLADTHFNRALALLMQEDYVHGLEEYEWRWRRPGRGMPDHGAPLWDGAVVPGKTLLVWSEQGLGDMIHCCRFAAVLAERGMRVFVQAPVRLVRLLRSLRGVAGVLGPRKRPDFDFHAPVMSLPKLCGMRRLDEAPGLIPYLAADPADVAAWRDRVRAGAAVVVGAVWRGKSTHAGDRLRSIPPSIFAALAQVPGIRVVSLVKEGAPQECEAAGAADIGAASWADFAESAAAFAHCDLVISVDTASAHLAGALGLPVWIALSLAPDWRWGLRRDDSPWYPTARLFRQEAQGDWKGVFARIVQELARVGKS